MGEIIEGEFEVIEERQVEVSVEPTPPEHGQWQGDCPFFLIIEPANPTPEGNIGIDLDQLDWSKTFAQFMRIPATWWLYYKETMTAVMVLVVHEGEQPYFSRHHIGNVITGATTLTYGLGKKLTDGTMVRTWLLPNGCVCGGDDVDEIGARIVNNM